MSEYTREQVIEMVKRGESLEGADLSKINLSGANLFDANFIGVNLSEAKFGGGYLTNTFLNEANLSKAEFISIELDGTNFHKADLSEAYFINSNINNVDLSSTNLNKAYFKGTILTETNLGKANLSMANLQGTKLRYVNLSGANLQGANLSRSEFTQVKLNNADLSEAKMGAMHLTGSTLYDAKLFKADLSGAILDCTRFKGADFNHSCLIKVRATFADFIQTNLSGAVAFDSNFFGCNFKKSNLSQVDFSSTRLNYAKLHEANLRNTNLQSADLEGANLTDADISGTNIYHIKTHGWKIDGIKCTHVYNCPDSESWNDQKDMEKYRRNFAPGEFEALYRTFPQIELIFRDEYRDIDHRALLAVLGEINQQLPQADIRLRRLEQTVNNTTATIQADNKEKLDEVAELLPKQYQILFDKLSNIEKMITNRTTLEQSQKNMSLALSQTIDLYVKGQQIIQPPVSLLVEGQTRDINISTAPIKTINYNQLIHNQNITIINNLVKSLDSPEFKNAELIEANNEFQKLYDSLDEKQQAELKKQAESLIDEKAKKKTFKEKLKNCVQWAAKEGWDIGKNILINILSEAAKGR
jgi:uncharacterized protein YjbI with pentapeptide repeats